MSDYTSYFLTIISWLILFSLIRGIGHMLNYTGNSTAELFLSLGFIGVLSSIITMALVLFWVALIDGNRKSRVKKRKRRGRF